MIHRSLLIQIIIKLIVFSQIKLDFIPGNLSLGILQNIHVLGVTVQDITVAGVH